MDEIIRERYSPQRVEHLRRAGHRRRQLAPRLGRCRELLTTQLLPLCRYFAYVQVAEDEQNLWEEYAQLREHHPHFAMQQDRRRRREIYPVFRDLFKKQAASEQRPRIATPTNAASTPKRGQRRAPCRDQSDWTFELIEHYHDAIRATAEQLRARHLSEPARDHHRRADDGRLRVGRHAGELPPLVATASSSSPTRRATGAASMGLAYEIVINSEPLHRLPDGGEHDDDAGAGDRACRLRPQLLLQGQLPVPACGPTPTSIIDYLVFAKNYIAECEERHGVDAVEELLDSCHALMNHGVDRYRGRSQAVAGGGDARASRSARPTRSRRSTTCGARCREREASGRAKRRAKRFPAEPQENLLYFIEKNAPLLEPWQREIVRIVRKIAQYFYPQRQTQVMNEGWATFWHYTLLNTLYDEGLRRRRLHDRVPASRTPTSSSSRRSTSRATAASTRTRSASRCITDIRRICESPTDEDREWFPDIAGSDWLQDARLRDAQLQGRELHRASTCRRKLMRDFRLFAIARRRRRTSELDVSAHPRRRRLPPRARGAVAPVRPGQRASPNIQVWSVNLRGDRSLTLRHTQHNDRPLHDSAQEVLKHVARLWGFGVHLESVDSQGRISHREVTGRRRPAAVLGVDFSLARAFSARSRAWQPSRWSLTRPIACMKA